MIRVSVDDNEKYRRLILFRFQRWNSESSRSMRAIFPSFSYFLYVRPSLDNWIDSRRRKKGQIAFNHSAWELSIPPFRTQGSIIPTNGNTYKSRLVRCKRKKRSGQDNVFQEIKEFATEQLDFTQTTYILPVYFCVYRIARRRSCSNK